MLRADANNTTNRIRRSAATSKPSAVCLLLSLFMATAAFASESTAPNDDFASAQVLPAGSLTVSGELETASPPGVTIAQESGTLVSGGVVSHDFLVMPGETYTAAIDNTASGTDTTLGSFDESFNLIATNDDSSFLGSGLASALTLTGNPDGTAHLMVSGYSDFDFDGLADGGTTPHGQIGIYDLVLFQGGFGGDVDVFAFTGLQVGQSYLAETFAGSTGTTPDTVLGLFDDLGSLVATDDDSGVGTLSQLEVTVPADGMLVLGVSGYSDFGFVGQHTASGSYSLSLRVVSVPEPTGIALLAFALVATGLRRQR